MITITLTPGDVEIAESIARMRRGNAVDRRRQPANGAPTEYDAALKLDYAGAYGECAANLYLAPIISWFDHRGVVDRQGNLIPDFEVRGRWPLKIDAKAVAEPTHRLIVQPDHKPDWAYLLVDGSDHPHHHMIGWCWGREAMQPRFLSDPVGGRAAYFVPRNDVVIRPPEHLLARVRRRQFVGYDQQGRFLHHCWCGDWGLYGYNRIRPSLGQWYCREHRPPV